jgi:hypothetical protein
MLAVLLKEETAMGSKDKKKETKGKKPQPKPAQAPK